MRSSRYALIIGLLVGSCSSTPTSETRNAVAPTGKLRVGMVMTANHATKDPATGELRGIAIDLGREAARRLGVAFEPVGYPSFAALWDGAKSGQWDMATMGITPERAQSVDFSPPYMTVEYAFLVPKESAISSPSEIDRPGIRVGVLRGAAPDQYLTEALRHAQVVRSATVEEFVETMRSGKADALFGTRAGMLNQVPKLPGSRVLDRAFGGEGTAIAVIKGRPLSAAYARDFVEEAKRDGLVKRVVDKAGLPGIIPAQ